MRKRGEMKEGGGKEEGILVWLMVFVGWRERKEKDEVRACMGAFVCT